jgi:hypothetical protein
MSGDRTGKWTEPTLLPELPPPPPDRIRVRGARLVRVYDPPGTAKVDGGREAVVLAWARLPDGAWAILLAWAGHFIRFAAWIPSPSGGGGNAAPSLRMQGI